MALLQVRDGSSVEVVVDSSETGDEAEASAVALCPVANEVVMADAARFKVGIAYIVKGEANFDIRGAIAKGSDRVEAITYSMSGNHV